jgi:putative ABC transport system permease protein
MVDNIFFQADRQDATLQFASERPPSAVSEVLHLPGVLRAEPYRMVPVRLRNGHIARQLAITGKPPDTDLSRVLDLQQKPVALPETGLALSDRVASILHVQRGDLLQVDLLEGDRRTVQVPVTEIIQSYLGLMVFMRIDALDRLAGTGPRVSGAHVAIDAARLPELYGAVKKTPLISAVALQTVSRQRFDETMQTNVVMMTTVYTTLSIIIAFGVIYNSARIQLSERARELATLRVLGFTRAEASRVLLTELGVMIAAAQPVGWALGFGFALLVVQGFQSDLFRIPFVMQPRTFAVASLVVVVAAIVSALVVRRRIDQLDLVQVLKTRD